MEEADKDWMMIRMVSGRVFLLVPAHPGSPGQRAVKRLWLLLLCTVYHICAQWYAFSLAFRMFCTVLTRISLLC